MLTSELRFIIQIEQRDEWLSLASISYDPKIKRLVESQHASPVKMKTTMKRFVLKNTVIEIFYVLLQFDQNNNGKS